MNIIYIHCHDAGRYLEPYGHAVSTPRLRAFSEEALTARKAFSAAPTCSPSRAALLTGQTAHQAGMLGLTHRGFGLRDERQHLAVHLASHGYETVLSGIQHEWDHKRGLRPRYETILPRGTEHDPDDPFGDRTAGRNAARYLRGRGDSRPLFLSVGFFYPHRPYPSPSKEFPPERAPIPTCLPDTPEIRMDMAGYQTALSVADQAFGEVWAALKETGMTRDSLILFTTDHGIAFPGMKCCLTDHGTGVAFMIKAPGLARPGGVTDALISHLDFFPTVCDYADLPVPGHCLGKSLRPLMESAVDLEGAESVFAEVNFHAAYEPMRAVRTRRYKYIRHYDLDYHPALPNIDPGPTKRLLHDAGLLMTPRPAEALYDLMADPNEVNNLALSDPPIKALATMRSMLDEWMKQTGDPLLEATGPLPAPDPSLIDPKGSVGRL